MGGGGDTAFRRFLSVEGKEDIPTEKTFFSLSFLKSCHGAVDMMSPYILYNIISW